jgi:DnaA family protein
VVHLPAAEAGAELPLAPGCLLVIDDIQQLGAEAQVALFRAFNAMRFLGLALLLAGNEPPLRLGLREDLRTRIGQTLIYEIQSLSDEEKSAALRRHAIERGMLMDPSVVHYLLRHGRRDLPSLMAMLNSLDRASLEQKRPPTLPLLRELMQTSFDLEKE